MKIAIRLEMYNYGDRAVMRICGIPEPYVKRITGLYNGNIISNYVNGYLDFALSNSVGSRGVIKHYFIGDGMYEIYERLSWKRFRTYFLKVANGKKHEITREEVIECLQSE